MGLVRYGIGIAQISGSAGGMVFARNKSGNYIRNRTKPVNPKSERQEAARTAVSFLAERWHADLDNTQRGLWGVYAAAVPALNKLGETIHLSGFNHFMRSNCAAIRYNRGLLNDAPTILSLPEKDTDLVCSEEDIATQTFTFTCNVGGWHPDTDGKTQMAIYQGQPQLISRQTYHGPFRYMDYIDPTEGAAGTADLVASYPFAVGQKVWFRARIMTVSGRLSEPWQIDPRDIVADP